MTMPRPDLALFVTQFTVFEQLKLFSIIFRVFVMAVQAGLMLGFLALVDCLIIGVDAFGLLTKLVMAACCRTGTIVFLALNRMVASAALDGSMGSVIEHNLSLAASGHFECFRRGRRPFRSNARKG